MLRGNGGEGVVADPATNWGVFRHRSADFHRHRGHKYLLDPAWKGSVSQIKSGFLAEERNLQFGGGKQISFFGSECKIH